VQGNQQGLNSQQLSPQERAAQEVQWHHDKAGLAAPFRTEYSDSQCPEVDFVEAKDLTVDAFWSRYVSCNRPVVVLGAVAAQHGWPDGGSWTEEALTTLVGHASINARTRPVDCNTFGDVSKFTGAPFAKPYDYEHITLADYFASLHEQPPKYYAARLELQEDMPELVGQVPSHYEVPWRHAFGLPYKDGVIFYMGAHRQRTPLHYDDVENLFFVLAGSKTVTLFPPGQAARLYPATQRLGTHYCLLPPAALHASSAEAEAWPLAREARGVEAKVPAGAMLYLPCCWLHSVQGSPELNVSANYWFAQSPKKLDLEVRRTFEQRTMDRWVRQLETMGLPASVMREAHDEAPRLVDAKIKLYEDWSWDHLQPSGHQEASQTTSSEDVHRLRCQSVDN